jgi:hypothetical protein
MITAARVVFTRIVSTPRAIIIRVAYRVKRPLLTLGLLISDVRTLVDS